jgi:malic enzyme
MAASASALKTFRSKLLPIEKYSFLRHLQSAEPLTLYRVLAANAMECLPFVYTPTVGGGVREVPRVAGDENEFWVIH